MISRAMTVKELSRILKVHPSTIYRLVKKGDAPVMRVGTRLRFGDVELEKLLNQRKMTPPSQRSDDEAKGREAAKVASADASVGLPGKSSGCNGVSFEYTNGHSLQRNLYSQEQIVALLKEVEAGKPIAKLCREYGLTEETYRQWKVKYAGLELPDARRLRRLEEENHRLKQLVADLTLDNQALKELLNQK